MRHQREDQVMKFIKITKSQSPYKGGRTPNEKHSAALRYV